MEFLVNIVRSSNTKDELFYNVIFVYCILSALFVPVSWLILGNTHKVLYVSLFIGMIASSYILWNRIDVSSMISITRKRIAIIVTPAFFIVFCLFFAITMHSSALIFIDTVALFGCGVLVIGGTIIMRR
jgi:hypothetical protein